MGTANGAVSDKLEVRMITRDARVPMNISPCRTTAFSAIRQLKADILHSVSEAFTEI